MGSARSGRKAYVLGAFLAMAVTVALAAGLGKGLQKGARYVYPQLQPQGHGAKHVSQWSCALKDCIQVPSVDTVQCFRILPEIEGQANRLARTINISGHDRSICSSGCPSSTLRHREETVLWRYMERAHPSSRLYQEHGFHGGK